MRPAIQAPDGRHVQYLILLLSLWALTKGYRLVWARWMADSWDAQMGLPTRFKLPVFPRERRVLVPYDKDGNPIAEGQPRMWWDLRSRQPIKITKGHNIQNARQRCFMHIGGDSEKVQEQLLGGVRHIYSCKSTFAASGVIEVSSCHLG